MKPPGKWEPTIGLEVHVQLQTRTKLFCRCETVFGAEPNTHVCPVCLGHPGVLPVLNRRAVALGVRAALALGMSVPPESKFDRKNYFYPDLPKGYQISQFDEPLGREGRIVLANGHTVRLLRLHLEEDAGKLVHDRGPGGLADFNRAGTPLAEIVSHPDLRTPEEAREYLERLKETLRWAEVSDCDMEKGNLRVDVNVSVAPPGKRATGTRAEIKNVNSFAFVVQALEFEIARQVAVLEQGGQVLQETRTWDEKSAATRSMRSKEEADDYRYFPEPDLPRLILDAGWLEEERRALPESPAACRTRYEKELGLSTYDAKVLTADRAIAAFFEELLAAGIGPKEAANWTGNEVLARVPPGESLGAMPLRAAPLAGALKLLAERRTNRNGVRTMLDRWMEGETRSPEELLKALGLAVQNDADALREVCLRALAAQPAAAEDVRNGREKALGALLGFVMRETRGAADPKLARELLLREIRG